jgi:anti-sigma regulatory factor (Ser/Thr protein kinase)
MSGVSIPVAEQSQVSEARRQAVTMCRELGFTQERAGAVALVVTEAATNLLKHAGSGTIVLNALAVDGARGIEVMALDRGPGMSNVNLSMQDGHSTAGSPGLGLGALSRLSSDFDVYSRKGAGTALRCAIWAKAAPARSKEIEIGAVCIPLGGETVAGDDWAVYGVKGRYILLVVDGLGHGPGAAEAAKAAKDTVEAKPSRTPAEHMDAIHNALRSTRGAAAAVIELKPSSEVGTFCGVGNIGCSVRSGGELRSLASHNGIVGHQMRKTQEFGFPFRNGALLFAYSDGMTSRWDASTYPGLESRHPALIAGVLYRDHNRGRDDTTIVVARNTRTD